MIELLDHTYLLHRYFSQAIRAWHGTGVTIPSKRSYATEYADGTQNLYFDALPFEYPTPGRGDYRLPALTAEGPSGAAVVDLKFCSWQVLPQKPSVPGLPMTFSAPDESETLEIVCSDPVSGIKVHLYYTIFRDLNIITRHQRMEIPVTPQSDCAMYKVCRSSFPQGTMNCSRSTAATPKRPTKAAPCCIRVYSVSAAAMVPAVRVTSPFLPSYSPEQPSKPAKSTDFS